MLKGSEAGLAGGQGYKEDLFMNHGKGLPIQS